MPRRPRDDSTGFGSDSFLDVIANVVGIMIILVIVAGVRAARAPADTAGDRPLDDLVAAVAAMEAGADAADARRAAAERALAAASDQRARLQSLVAQREADLADRRAQATLAVREADQAAREIALAGAELDRLHDELSEVLSQRPETVTIESYPTPISQTVDGPEAHFRLSAGRIVAIPIDELLEQLRSQAVGQVWRLREQPEATDVVGPVGGFRMRYTMRRVDASLDARFAGAGGGSYAQLAQWTLVPSDAVLGETLEEALAPDSQFRAALAAHDPRDVTVTLWTYPDSFAEYRALRKELFRLGYATAGRPLPDGHPIGGSPDGSRSAAQ
jgi:hypothetical protein